MRAPRPARGNEGMSHADVTALAAYLPGEPLDNDEIAARLSASMPTHRGEPPQ